MSLSGNLGFVPIDEVLRLLTRSHQKGSVEVAGNGVRGRVFVGGGGIDLATTYDDQELSRQLLNAGYADSQLLDRITSGETTLAAIAENDPGIVELLREMSVEGLYQIATIGDEFQVQEGVATPYASPQTFELEAMLEDVDQRRKDWQEVASVIPDLSKSVGFRRDLGSRKEITLNVNDWKFLSEIRNGSSVEEVAERLGTTEFWTARVAAHLLGNELIVVEDHEASGVEAHEIPTVFEEPRMDNSDDDVDPDESWWQEPRDELPAAEEAPSEGAHPDGEDGSRTPEVVSEGLSEIPPVEDVTPNDETDVEEDTEAFLEKVFSELGSSDSESDSEEGHGLLRRRRMGTLRDFSSDS